MTNEHLISRLRDVILRSGVEDAEALVSALEKRIDRKTSDRDVSRIIVSEIELRSAISPAKIIWAKATDALSAFGDTEHLWSYSGYAQREAETPAWVFGARREKAIAAVIRDVSKGMR